MTSPGPKIYVAGHRGMVGSAITRVLQRKGNCEIVTRSHENLDLTNQRDVRTFFATERPQQVYLAAARVGGIHANNTYPAEFIYNNLVIEANVDPTDIDVVHPGLEAQVRLTAFSVRNAKPCCRTSVFQRTRNHGSPGSSGSRAASNTARRPTQAPSINPTRGSAGASSPRWPLDM